MALIFISLKEANSTQTRAYWALSYSDKGAFFVLMCYV